MIPGIVGKSIRRVSINCILLATFIFFAIACFLGANQRLFRNYFHGPTPTTITAITKLPDADAVDAYWVRTDINGDAARLGSLRYNTKDSTTYYTPVRTAAGFLLLDANTPNPSGPFEGDIDTYSSFEERSVLPRLPEDIRTRLLPVILRHSSVAGKAFVILIFSGFVAFCALSTLAFGTLCFFFPRLHPASRVLKRFGKPEEIAVAVDAELRAGASKTSKFHLTQSWLLHQGIFGLYLFYLGDVTWVYKRRFTQCAYFIPVYTHTYVVISDRYGKQKTISLRSHHVDELLAAIHRAVPWAFIGFNRDLKRLWNRDRRNFLMGVHNRKATFLQKIKNGEPAKGYAPPEETVRIIRRNPSPQDTPAPENAPAT